MKRFNKVLKDTKGILKILPILHSCDGYSFRSILESSNIETYKCKVFNEDYLYTYYGIPSYRKSSESATKNMAYFPVCFILNYDNIPKLDKLYPFDTGAFCTMPDIKKDHFHSKMDISDFELEPNIVEAVKIVEKFYNTNNKYLENDPCVRTCDFEETEFEARSYTSLISSEANTKYDNRVSTIELIYKQMILLNKESLTQVILPHNFLDDPFIEDTLITKFNIISPLTYYTIKGNPNENFGSVYNEYRKFAYSNNLI